MVVLCVVLGKLVAWNLWTGEARERRRKELLCGAYLRDIRVLPMRKAGVTGHKMGCKAKADRMGTAARRMNETWMARRVIEGGGGAHSM